ncbi:hypothetical protein H920_11696 [Fukomys damarensis]|uniref:Uncharacterized protein n=1 Tax=Fukomys damarensis TaxID=885580 RepID=A0A091DVV0_FUKDA|nr:hypothetical protein H920_11696 [Fukomys damarensis]
MGKLDQSAGQRGQESCERQDHRVLFHEGPRGFADWASSREKIQKGTPLCTDNSRFCPLSSNPLPCEELWDLWQNGSYISLGTASSLGSIRLDQRTLMGPVFTRMRWWLNVFGPHWRPEAHGRAPELPVPFASVSQTCGSVSKELEKRPRRCFRYPRTFCGFDNFLCE